ncbi:HxlR family transcriptional regulator [Kribbella amoyensis]|uniref:HxlR family transcriptional regulator n=1 Tax=Kribbella amoyensis TaxID=996641 RepID=A0A561BQA9_9ACTN|nr:helix-turn-helix domain-containing protein [Kribbella amoyensis]TWD81050.1 HxlR family transcriptional regulator [Kribbella amoyensis]
MTSKTYGQYCGVARALELVGERWAMLIIRDLLVGPKRYTDLRTGLPKIPTNVLSTRLKELEQSGVVERQVEAPPSRAIVYRLTEYGADLDQAVLALGRWGARSLGELRPGEIATAETLVMALRSTFQPTRGRRTTYELRFGEVVVHAIVAGGKLVAEPGPLDGADVRIEAYAPLSPLLAGELDGAAALKAGMVGDTASAAELDRFAETFRIGRRAEE